MRKIFLTILIALWSHASSSENELIEPNKEVKTQLTDLNADVLFIIFNKLQWFDLQQMVEASGVTSRITDIAYEVMRRKHYKLQFSFERMNRKYITIESDGQNKIIIYDFQTALNVLKFLGNTFQSLIFYYDYLNVESAYLQGVSQALYKYCSKYLQRLELEMGNSLLEHFTMPFESIEELKIKGYFYDFHKFKPLNELFPNLQRLTFYSYSCKAIVCNSIEFSHLEYFFINQRYGENLEHVEKLIQRNPTIRTIEADILNVSAFVKFISQQPNIENLIVFGVGNETVRLENVKHFEIKRLKIESIGKILMPNLESSKIPLELSDTNMWMEFFSEHTQLRRLHFTKETEVDLWPNQKRNVHKIIEKLTSLSDVIFDVKGRGDTDFMMELLHNNKNLDNCRMRMRFVSIFDKQIFQENLQNKWNTDSKRVLIELKLPALD